MAMHLLFILLCLMPDDFTRQVKSAASQWLIISNYLPMQPVKPLTGNAPRSALLYYFTLSNTK
jgi:hypothetical protein